MKKLVAIGEALIDMIPSNTGGIKNVTSFSPNVGGAPANVCCAYSSLCKKENSQMITMLGNDPFGDKIVDEFQKYQIDTSSVLRTDVANTSLAFVALQDNGNREFSFYRKPGADMLLDKKDIHKEWFTDAYCLHFCSVSLGDFPMKQASDIAIAYAKEAGCIISFDPNVRLPLWKDPAQLRKVILEYIPKCHILKISDEELEFITGKKVIEDALNDLFVGDVQLVIYTEGSNGAKAFTKNTHAYAKQEKVDAIDTTGAGDGFIGSFLYQLSRDGIDIHTLSQLTQQQLEQYLVFSNKFCAISVTKHGAMNSYPSEIE